MKPPGIAQESACPLAGAILKNWAVPGLTQRIFYRKSEDSLYARVSRAIIHQAVL